MIVNNGMKGALIRNAGLPGQYLEDLPPNDGSQRLYNLRDYSARFGGATNLAESSILLADGRMVSMYSYLKKTQPLLRSWINPIFDDTLETITFNRAYINQHNKVAVVYPLPDGYQNFSLSYKVHLQSSKGEDNTGSSGHAPLRLIDWSKGVSLGSVYNNDSFCGTDFYKTAGGTRLTIRSNVGMADSAHPLKTAYIDIPTGTVLKVGFSKHGDILKVEKPGGDSLLFSIHPPEALFLGFDTYGAALSYAIIPNN